MKGDERRDRRVERSKQSLRDALIELVIEQGFEATTVAAIAERANVGRSTFYAHFADKEELFADSVDHLEELLMAAPTGTAAASASDHPALAFSLPLLEHANDSRELYKALLSPRGGALLHSRMHDLLARVVSERLAYVPRRGGPPKEVVVEFVVGAFWGIVTWWLAKPSALTPVEIDQAFKVLVLPALRALE